MKKLLFVAFVILFVTGCASRRRVAEVEKHGVRLMPGEKIAYYESCGSYLRVVIVDNQTRKTSELTIYTGD